MPSEILSKYSTPTVTASFSFAGTLNSLADTNGVQSTRVLVASPVAPQVRISGNIVTGAAPTANTLVEFYIARGDDAASEIYDGNCGGISAGWGVNGPVPATQTKPMVEFVFALVVTATANNPYEFSFMVSNQGPNWVLICVNETGDALNAANNVIHYRYVTPEIQ
jgi:hypothetical protein